MLYNNVKENVFYSFVIHIYRIFTDWNKIAKTFLTDCSEYDIFTYNIWWHESLRSHLPFVRTLYIC